MITPLNTKILVEEIQNETKSPSGIILDAADSTKDSKSFKVIDVGSEITTVTQGDYIYLDWAKVKPVKFEGKQYAFIDIEDVFGFYQK